MDAKDRLSDGLTDQALVEEIALLGEVMATAATATGPLSQADVDVALGLDRAAEDIGARLSERAVIERATGHISQTHGLGMTQARDVLKATAARSGITELDAARAILSGPSPET